MQCESTRGTAGAMGGGSADEPMPGAIQVAAAAAIEDGATMDEIVERVRALGGDRSPSAEGRWAARIDGLICLQREADRCAEEWVRTREPGAEGRSALVAIETLRTLALVTMAELGKRAEPVPTEDLARLALALHRIENADRLRIEREQTMADAAAHAGPAARAASMTHAERVETVRRALEGHFFPGRADPPPPNSEWAAASPADSHVTPPDPTPESPADDDGAQDVWDAHRARDTWDAHRARDAELRRREVESQIWPTDPHLLPLGMERAGVRPAGPHPPQTSTYPPGSCFSPKILPRSWSARCFRAVPKGKKLPSGAAQLFSARGTFQARATRTMVRCTACAPRLRLAVHERAGQGRKDERA